MVARWMICRYSGAHWLSEAPLFLAQRSLAIRFAPTRTNINAPFACSGETQQIVGPEPREATFASSVIRLSCSVAPWPGQLNRYVAFSGGDNNSYESRFNL